MSDLVVITLPDGTTVATDDGDDHESPLIERIVRYKCIQCGQKYPTVADAMMCAEQGFVPLLAPGDIVVFHDAHERGQYNWHDGDPLWHFRDFGPDRHPHNNYRYSFYYVVTAVTKLTDVSYGRYGAEGHIAAYHVLTRGIRNNKQNLPFRGWTTDNGHIRMVKVDNPPAEVVRQGRKFIGYKTRSLL